MRSIAALLHGLIDYAGMFPPASLDLSSAAAHYRNYRGQAYSWMLGRFVVPLSLLNEFAAYSKDIPDTSLSILAELGKLNASQEALPSGSVFEIKVQSQNDVAAIRKALPAQRVYIEVQDGKWTAELFEAVAEAKAGAKLRSGGVDARSFPSPENVAAFMTGCQKAGIPWKATAGLHHPFRGVYRLRYEPDSESALMHGFMNVFLAAVLIYCGEAEDAALELLNEQSAERFAFDDGGVTWSGYRLTTDQIRATREQFAMSFGSCSFDDPVSDLQALQLL